MPTPELRRVTDDEWLPLSRAWTRVFHDEIDDDNAEAWRGVLPAERCWTATDDVGYVASSGAIPFRLSVPGGGTVGCAGVTAVTVRSDHRRRGLLRAMITRLHDDARDREEPVAALYASEAAIYGRFGYGPSVPMHKVEIRSQDLARIRGGHAGRVRLVDRATYLELAPRLADAIGTTRGGMLTLAPGGWKAHARDDDPKWPDWFAAVGDRGLVRYRAKHGDWVDRVPNDTLDVIDLFAVDSDAEADLWAHVGAVDLVTEVRATHRPSDDPLRWRLPDEARVRDRSRHPMYVRLLDLPAAMAARTWEVADRLVLEVADDSAPDNAGCWSLDAGPDGAEMTRTDDPPDASMDVADLASLWLGGVAPATLAAAGRLTGTDTDVLARLRRLFAVDRAPWTPFNF